MPVVLRYKGYTLFFFSNEGDPLEPVHVHVRGGGALAKFWVGPAVTLAENHGFSGSQLNEIEHVVDRNASQIKEAWDDHFGS